MFAHSLIQTCNEERLRTDYCKTAFRLHVVESLATTTTSCCRCVEQKIGSPTYRLNANDGLISF